MCAPKGNGRAKAGRMGFDASLYFSNSASWSLLALALLFWNHILTCVSVRLRELENSALSAMDRYCFCRNFLSSASNWEVVKGVRGFLLFLCFLKVHGGGLELAEIRHKLGKQVRKSQFVHSYSKTFPHKCVFNFFRLIKVHMYREY